MDVKFAYKASIVHVFEPRKEYCARCSRKDDCRGALITLEYQGVRSEACASHIPRETLEKARERGESILLGGDGRIALENFKG